MQIIESPDQTKSEEKHEKIETDSFHPTNFLKKFKVSHFAPAFYALSPQRRHDLKVLYTIYRVLDDAVDKPHSDSRGFLNAWSSALVNSEPNLLTEFKQEKLASEFIGIMKKYDIPLFSILDLIKVGLWEDLNHHHFETTMDTERYCYGVAGTVGIACLPIFGVPWEQAKDFAVRLGITVQWINLIRDVGSDAKMKRVYLPLDHLEKFNCSSDDILAGRMTTSLASLLRYETEVARSYYKRAMELMPIQWEKELLPARMMGNIYIKLLEKIEQQKYPVFEKRVTLNFFEKAWVTWKTKYS
jgi:phytoene synthase